MEKMDVDEDAQVKVSVHPLAIVNMSDQYTRISCGGTPLASDSPVTGLLFGILDDSKHLRVTDAEDIPTEATDIAATPVSLHQAVFPQHAVVGWYRVVNSDSGPSALDLQMTNQLKQHYQKSQNNASDHHFLFALLQVATADQQKPKAENNDDDEEEELPFSLYHLSADGQVLVALEDAWNLDTAVAERIAVERVIREQPQINTSMTDSNNKNEPTAPPEPRSKFVEQTTQVQHSLAAIQQRLTILQQFLENTASGKIPFDHSLVRQVQSLLLQAGLLSAFAKQVPTASTAGTNTTSTVDLLQRLTVLAKTVDAVQTYTDKVKAIHEPSPHHHARQRF